MGDREVFGRPADYRGGLEAKARGVCLARWIPLVASLHKIREARVPDRGISYEGEQPPQMASFENERRVALVIGNGAYTHAEPLEDPVRDAESRAS